MKSETEESKGENRTKKQSRRGMRQTTLLWKESVHIYLVCIACIPGDSEVFGQHIAGIWVFGVRVTANAHVVLNQYQSDEVAMIRPDIRAVSTRDPNVTRQRAVRSQVK